MATRKPYPSDVSDEEWTFVAPYLALVREDAPQREYDLREVLNGLRWVVRTGGKVCSLTIVSPSCLDVGARDVRRWQRTVW